MIQELDPVVLQQDVPEHGQLSPAVFDFLDSLAQV
jgi:hypothetical protein